MVTAWNFFFKKSIESLGIFPRNVPQAMLLISWLKVCSLCDARFVIQACSFTIASWKAKTEAWLLLLYVAGQGQEEIMCNCVSVVMQKDTNAPNQCVGMTNPANTMTYTALCKKLMSRERNVFCFSREWGLNPFAYRGRFHPSL